ncbi:MAG: HAMP domain-containing protein [Fischerella sp.]|jgi:heavy metal sensor kinase|uniref:sensor histidine kinase n=1 Tax=Fischerella sp. TaxID=1191 RepID=UPI001816C614|nr:ATP-binding protein [Fischerella sp.]NWF58444.1 HAMP domain-containing protein [Fischerella sp.]
MWRKIDTFSLRLRLIIGIAALSALGNGGIAMWTSWKMQQLLIDSHKQNIEHIAARFPHDVELYSEMMSPVTGLQKAINNLTTTNIFLWVKNPEQKVIAKSITSDSVSNARLAELMSLAEMPIKPQVHQISQHYFVLCGDSLQVQGKMLGKLFVVQDITREQTMFLTMVRSVGIASFLVIVVISGAIALYIYRSLQPLRQLNQMTAVISAADLPEAQLSVDNAPSEVKELAQTFNMLLSRLSQSWEQERQFVSNVSHELRTPLTIVHGYLQSVLRRPHNLTETQIEALETAASEAEHTIRLLEDLLDLARADSGYLHFHIESYILNDLVAEVVAMAEQYSERAIKIEADIDSIQVKADHNRLKQVLLNLIDNAIKYSEPGTPILLKINQQEQEAIIQVCDRGYGIPLQHQSRIFERFYRVDESRHHATGGAGLGLSIVKTLVEGMGGKVSVRSRLGEGSIFTVVLPSN